MVQQEGEQKKENYYMLEIEIVQNTMSNITKEWKLNQKREEMQEALVDNSVK